MVLTPRRSTQRRWFRNLIYAFGALLVLDLWSTLNRYKSFTSNLATSTIGHVEDLPPQARNQKIYIIAQFWTNADVLVDHWNQALVELIDTLGHENVYVSILSSAGLDNTNEVVGYLDNELLGSRSIARTIIIDPTSHDDEINKGPVDKSGRDREGWLQTGDKKELRRIPYLAKLRNRGLEPLQEMYEEQGVTYDKILFLNDVIFETRDILSLLATNHGVYDVACSFDFRYPPLFYDTFALRDSNGDSAATQFFPFYRSRASRHALVAGGPIPVKSCWNGAVVADAAPYYDRQVRTDPTAKGSKGLTTTLNGLRFRGISDSLAGLHLEGSECCLIHADLAARGQLKKGIFMNPAVRVGYSRDKKKYQTTAYEDTHIGPSGLAWVTSDEYIYGIWKNRFQRWTHPVWIDKWGLRGKLNEWKRTGKKTGEQRQEPGDFCIIDETHILISNGWKHVW